MKSNRSKIAVTVAGMAIMLCVGILYMWSVFLPYVTEYHGWSTSDVAMTSSLMVAFFVLGNITGGLVQEKISPRIIALCGSVLFSVGIYLSSLLGSERPALIYLTYGLISGVGCGLAYCAVLAVVQKWWAARIGFISGLTVCFFGLSVVVLSPVAKSMLAALGVPETFRLLSIVFAVITIGASLFLRNPSKEYYAAEVTKSFKAEELKQFKPSQVVHLPSYYFLLVTMFTCNAAYMVIVPYITTIGLARGLSETTALLAVMCTGLANSLGRVLAPAVSDRIGRTRTMNICAGVSCAACILMVFARGWFYVAAVFLIAFAYGGGSGINPVISTELFGARYSGANYGLLLIGLAASSVVFGKVASMVAGGDFNVTFLACAVICVVPVIMMLCLRRHCEHYGKHI